jgi:hypothetical protein
MARILRRAQAIARCIQDVDFGGEHYYFGSTKELIQHLMSLPSLAVNTRI